MNWLQQILSNLFPVQQPAGLVNDPVVQGRLNNERKAVASGAYTSGGGTNPTAQQTLRYATSQPQPQAQTQTTTTGGGGGGGGGNGSGNPQPQQPQAQGDIGISAADQMLMAQRAAIKAKYDAAQRQASDELARAGVIRDDTMSGIGRFRDRAKEAYTNADQQIVDTASGQYGQGIEGFNDLQKNLYNQFAARNIGLSSQIASQGKAREGLVKQQGSVTAEKGRNSRENTLMFNERGDQATGYENTARQQYQSAVDSANNLGRLGTDQFGADEGMASAAYAQTLGQLQERAQQLALLKLQIPTDTVAYQPKFNIPNALNGVAQTPGATTAPSGFGATSAPANVTSDSTLLAELKKKYGLL